MVDAAPKVDHTNHANKLVAKGLMATRGILAVAMLAGMAGLGGSAPAVRASQIVEGGGGVVSCTSGSNVITTTETCQEIVGCTNSVDVNRSPISITFTNCVDIGINALQYDVVVCRSVCP